MERALLRAYQTFGKEIERGTPWSQPRCRICQEGCVPWDKPITAENKQSKKTHNHWAFEPEWIAGPRRCLALMQVKAGSKNESSGF
jgi:hypothetical protein